MLVGLIIACIIEILFHSIFWAIFEFYFITGLWKSYRWITTRSRVWTIYYIPDVLRKQDILSFILGLFLWVPICIVHKGDPFRKYLIKVKEINI
jgi:hypothetical protein